MINQPHEGGLLFLEYIFYNILTQGDSTRFLSEGLQSKLKLFNVTTYTPPYKFGPVEPRIIVGLYTKVDSTTWVDSVTYQEQGFDTYWFEPINAFNESSPGVPNPSYDSWINGAGTSNMVMTCASLQQQVGQNNRVQEIGNVPQIQFPEVIVSFSGALSGKASSDVVGYYVKLGLDVHNSDGNTGSDHGYGTMMLFRELFDTPVTPANGVTLRFTPLLRLGNISSNTTLI